MDESLGLLFYALRQHGCLPFIAPAFTAHLDVDYKKVYTSILPNSTPHAEAIHINRAGKKRSAKQYAAGSGCGVNTEHHAHNCLGLAWIWRALGWCHGGCACFDEACCWKGCNA